MRIPVYRASFRNHQYRSCAYILTLQISDEVYDTKGSKNGGAKEKKHRKKKRRAFEFYWEEMRGEYAKR